MGLGFPTESPLRQGIQSPLFQLRSGQAGFIETVEQLAAIDNVPLFDDPTLSHHPNPPPPAIAEVQAMDWGLIDTHGGQSVYDATIVDDPPGFSFWKDFLTWRSYVRRYPNQTDQNGFVGSGTDPTQGLILNLDADIWTGIPGMGAPVFPEPSIRTGINFFGEQFFGPAQCSYWRWIHDGFGGLERTWTQKCRFKVNRKISGFIASAEMWVGYRGPQFGWIGLGGISTAFEMSATQNVHLVREFTAKANEWVETPLPDGSAAGDYAVLVQIGTNPQGNPIYRIGGGFVGRINFAVWGETPAQWSARRGLPIT